MIGQNGLIAGADDQFADGVAEAVGRGIRTAEAYDSPARHRNDTDDLQAHFRRAKAARRRTAEPLYSRFVIESDLRALADGVDVGGLFNELPPQGATVIHAATPGLEYEVQSIPGTRGDSVFAIVMQILGIAGAASETLQNPESAIEISQKVHRGEIGNRTCDWRTHSASHRGKLLVYDMRVLLMAEGNRIYAWVCCPACVRKLRRRYPRGLCWLPANTS